MGKTLKAAEFTNHLKKLVEFFSQKGYKPTVINKLLLGSSGFTQLNKLMANENETFLGIKPLQRMCEPLECDVHIVIVPREDSETIQLVTEKNEQFLENLKELIINFLNNNNNMDLTVIKNKKAHSICNLLDDIIEDFQK